MWTLPKALILAVSGCLILGITVAALSLHRAKSQARARQTDELTRQIRLAIVQAEQEAQARNFEDATEHLHQAQQRLNNARFVPSEIEAELQAALHLLQASEQDFREKTAQGYVMFEDRFIPSSERDRILAERQQAEEQRRAEAEQRERRRQEELARAAAEQVYKAIQEIQSLSEKLTPPEPPKPAPIDDLRDWQPDPDLPKPEITAQVQIIKEPERKKISMRITATEAHGLTVHEVLFLLKYRTYSETSKRYRYPKRLSVYKLIPKIEKGHAVWTTAIVEKPLAKKAWKGTDDNWEVEIISYRQYYKEPGAGD